MFVYVMQHDTSEDGESIAIGDQVWWQGRNAYWTALGGKEDVSLPRIGFSFDPRQQQ